MFIAKETHVQLTRTTTEVGYNFIYLFYLDTGTVGISHYHT
jgi:hypothetical protein